MSRKAPDADPDRTLSRAVILRWPGLVGFMVAGALVGSLIAAALPRTFLAEAVVNVDHNVDEVLPEANIDETAMYLNRESLRLESLAYSDRVWREVARTLGAEGWPLPPTLDGLRQRVLLPHPADGTWRFAAVDPDPAFAARLATIWAEVFVRQVHDEVMRARRERALREREADLQVLVADLEARCALETANSPSAEECFERLADLRQAWEAVAADLEAAAEGLKGVSPYLEVALVQEASIPAEPREQSAMWLLLGAVLGGLVWGFSAWRGSRLSEGAE